MIQEEFYITLPSNVKSFYENNTTSTFRTQLKQKLDFPREENWKVALSEIFLNKTWFNIEEDTYFYYFKDDGRLFDFYRKLNETIITIEYIDDPNAWRGTTLHGRDLLLQKGYYTLDSLITRINEILHHKFQFTGVSAKIVDNRYNGIISVYAGTELQENFIFPFLGEHVEKLLGLTDNSRFYHEIFKEHFEREASKVNDLLRNSILTIDEPEKITPNNGDVKGSYRRSTGVSSITVDTARTAERVVLNADSDASNRERRDAISFFDTIALSKRMGTFRGEHPADVDGGMHVFTCIQI